MLAIHKGEGGFHVFWRDYCKLKGIAFKNVDCYSNDIVEQLSDCDALMWHHSQNNPIDCIVAKQILFAFEQSGKIAFPDFKTNWHFDDKMGQKYLLELLKIPMPRSYAFFNRNLAIEWARQTEFPKVFKLRGGAGSSNVQLIHTHEKAIKIINKAFSTGFSNYSFIEQLKETFRLYKMGKRNIKDVTKSILRFIVPPDYSIVMGREVGYVYFQDYIQNNDFDIRVVIIDNKAFAIKRMVRKGDFRASGSGNIIYERSNFDEKIISTAFEASDKLKAQCVAYDFVIRNNEPLIVEISYGFSPHGYFDCPGYWDASLTWHEGKFDPYGWMVDLVMGKVAVYKK